MNTIHVEKFVLYPNPQGFELQTRTRLVLKPERYENPLWDYDKQSKLIKNIFMVKGVERVRLDQHCIIIYGAASYTREEVIDAVKAVVEGYNLDDFDEHFDEHIVMSLLLLPMRIIQKLFNK